MSFKKIHLCVAIFLLIILSACSGASTQEEIYDHLEEAVALEKGFEEQQNEITELEKQEQKLYNQIINLTMDEFDKIKELSQQAIDTIDKRSNKIDLEKESIEASQEEFIKTEELIAELDEQSVKEAAEEMYEVMADRYDAYNNLYEAYINSLQLEKELYLLLQKEDIEQEEVTTHIEKVNDGYQKVLEVNEKFNADTIEYNSLKKEFYDLANIEVEYEED